MSRNIPRECFTFYWIVTSLLFAMKVLSSFYFLAIGIIFHSFVLFFLEQGKLFFLSLIIQFFIKATKRLSDVVARKTLNLRRNLRKTF